MILTGIILSFHFSYGPFRYGFGSHTNDGLLTNSFIDIVTSQEPIWTGGKDTFIYVLLDEQGMDRVLLSSRLFDSHTKIQLTCGKLLTSSCWAYSA